MNSNDENHWSEKLVNLCACGKAIEWAKTQPSYEVAWDTCHRSDWLLWLVQKVMPRTDENRKLAVLVACACARTSLRFVKPGEYRPTIAIETAEAWTRGEATIEDVQHARSNAYAAAAAYAAYAYAAAADAAAAAADAVYAANAADYAADAAAYAADAADAAAYAADTAAAAYNARAKARKEMAEIVRSVIKRPELP